MSHNQLILMLTNYCKFCEQILHKYIVYVLFHFIFVCVRHFFQSLWEQEKETSFAAEKAHFLLDNCYLLYFLTKVVPKL